MSAAQVPETTVSIKGKQNVQKTDGNSSCAAENQNLSPNPLFEETQPSKLQLTRFSLPCLDFKQHNLVKLMKNSRTNLFNFLKKIQFDKLAEFFSNGKISSANLQKKCFP